MSTEKETLFTLTRGKRVLVFRTRQAQRNFRKAQRQPAKYVPGRASWGPES